MEIRGTPGASDPIAAQWLHVKPRRSYAIVGVVILVAAVWGVWYSFSVPALRNNGWLLLGSLVLMSASAFWMRYRTVRTYGQLKSLHRPTRLEPTDSGIYSENETGSGIIPWGDFLKWKEDKHLFLLYVADDRFHLLPKRFFVSETEIGQFREILRARVARVEG